MSVLVLGEIRRGAERLRLRDPGGAVAVDHWLTEVGRAFDGRILPVDSNVADEWGRMSAPRSIPVIDCLLAAMAKANDLTLAIHNVRDVENLGVRIVNPFTPLCVS